ATSSPSRSFLDVRLGGKDPRPVKPQYQQSNGVDIVCDAPWRLEPNRPYVPVMIFVPSKGEVGKQVEIRIDYVRIYAKAVPTVGVVGSLLYAFDHGIDTNSDPRRFARGTTIVDEDGNTRTKGAQGTQDLNVFADAALFESAHHDILRFPRDAFGIPPVPATPADRFVDVRLHFEATRKLV